MTESQKAALLHLRMVNSLAEATGLVRLEAIVVARDLELTWEEIAEALDMTRQTAHKRYGHARNLLRRQLQAKTDDDSVDDGIPVDS